MITSSRFSPSVILLIQPDIFSSILLDIKNSSSTHACSQAYRESLCKSGRAEYINFNTAYCAVVELVVLSSFGLSKS